MSSGSASSLLHKENVLHLFQGLAEKPLFVVPPAVLALSLEGSEVKGTEYAK
jgi:hypothetical protein